LNSVVIFYRLNFPTMLFFRTISTSLAHPFRSSRTRNELSQF